ncbi:MAG: vitamin K epoxide reductase family protein [Candidatus Uhrbacteria bacterium]|nr:vitamin K epoxide reductase family protein [Candidatus Uhrbacteria bacterium]
MRVASPKLLNTWLVVSFLGFIDAAYLSASHFTHVSLPCTITHGCEIVTSSTYAVTFGIPVALFGAAYYLSVFFGIVTYKETKNPALLRGISLLTVSGLAASAWFLYVQAFLLRAFCQYCLLSAITSTVLFALGMYTLHFLKTSSSGPSPHAVPSE